MEQARRTANLLRNDNDPIEDMANKLKKASNPKYKLVLDE